MVGSSQKLNINCYPLFQGRRTKLEPTAGTDQEAGVGVLLVVVRVRKDGEGTLVVMGPLVTKDGEGSSGKSMFEFNLHSYALHMEAEI